MIIHVTSGLMATSALTAAAREVGIEVKLAMNDRKLLKLLNSEQVDLVVIDLQTKGLNVAEAVVQIKEVSKSRIIAYAQHVYEDLLNDANQLEIDAVMTRGQFTRELPQIVASAS